MWEEIADMSGEIFDIDFDFDDVPAEVKNDPEFKFEDEFLHDSRKALLEGAILRGYTHAQVKKASDERLRVMNDSNTRRNRSKLALM
jgi:hypothetical protein